MTDMGDLHCSGCCAQEVGMTGESDQLEHAGALRSILDSMGDGVVVADSEGRFVLFNLAAERILGLGKQDIEPTEWAQVYGLFLPDQKTIYPMDRLPLMRAIRGEEVSLERIYVRQRGSAEGSWISVSAKPLSDRTGGIQGGVAVFRDVTELVRSDRTVRMLSNAVEEAADPVFITDPHGVFSYVNPAFEKTTGYSRDDVAGKTPRIMKSGQHDAAFYKQLWDCIQRGDVFRGSVVNRKKSGELFLAEQTITPIKDEQGRLSRFVALTKDMTERTIAQAQKIELEVASVVQSRMYPKSAPSLVNCDIAGSVFPASFLCGDYFDYLTMRDGMLGVALGDVCGHGLGPALVMAETRAFLRSLVPESAELAKVFTTINGLLLEDLTQAAFVALIVVQIDPNRRYLSYCNAGHTAGYLLTGAGSVKAALQSRDHPLGMFGKRHYSRSEEIALESGDLLLLFTDGVTEAECDAGNEFGEERVLEIAREHRNESSQAIIRHIHAAAREFAGHQLQVDDMALVVCKFE